jgi:hypothetical protein
LVQGHIQNVKQFEGLECSIKGLKDCPKTLRDSQFEKNRELLFMKLHFLTALAQNEMLSGFSDSLTITYKIQFLFGSQCLLMHFNPIIMHFSGFSGGSVNIG